MSTVVVLNPGASRARRDLQRVRAAIADSPLLSGAEVIPSEGWEQGRVAAAEAAERRAPLVVAAGGDGTVNSVVNGLMAVDAPRPLLGVLPLGTGNDLARSLGIPADLASALGELERRDVRTMDVLRVEQGDDARYCANVSAGGFSGRVDEDLSGEAKESWGPLAYLRTALGKVGELRPYEVSFEVDGREPAVEISALNVVVANARYAAAGVPVAPEAFLDDGVMDVVVLTAGSLPKLGMVVARMAAGRHLADPLVRVFRARRLTVSAEPEMSFNVDGELLGAGTTRFGVLGRELPVLVGSNRPPAL